jgi:hypothetical protein
MSASFFVQRAECRLVICPTEYPSVEINIIGFCPKVAICSDAVKIADFEKSVEAFVRKELPKFVKLAEVES